MNPSSFDLLFAKLSSIIQLTSHEKNIVQQLFHVKEVKKEDFFVMEGQICRQSGFVIKGLLRYFINDQGEEKTYAFGYENCFVSNYESFVSQQPSTKNIQALEDTTMLTISYHDLQQFYQQVKEGERFGRIVIESVFIESLQEITSLYTDSAEQRYQKFLQQYPSVGQRIPQYHIASYVGVQPQSLSRIRRRMASSY
jgi:CRP-like cAMP-binding protein